MTTQRNFLTILLAVITFSFFRVLHDKLHIKTLVLQKRIEELETNLQSVIENNNNNGNIPNNNNNNNHNNLLPSCQSLMQRKNSSFANGEFLTRYSTPGVWIPRADGSRQYDLASICTLHRYTAQEARQCLTGKHIHFIGDSVTRFQMLSLAHLIHKGYYPPRFKVQKPDCTHIDENGKPTCSPPNEPNICSAGDFASSPPRPPDVDLQEYFQGIAGGWYDGGLFDGHMECPCARLAAGAMTCSGKIGCEVDNYLYSSPFKGSGENLKISLLTEFGWGDAPRPITGFNFTDCSKKGTCRRSPDIMRPFIERANKYDHDWMLPILEAIGEKSPVRQQLPKPDIAIYNRGWWGQMKADRTKQIMSALRSWVGHPINGGRCIFRSTSGGKKAKQWYETERQNVRPATLGAGCSYFDVAHMTEDFAAIEDLKERRSILLDEIHYQPWVYEEINNLMLNLLCNDRL